MKIRLISGLFLAAIFFSLIGVVYIAWKESRQAQVIVEWSTASEFDTVGFNLYRSVGSTDPGQRVNTELIPASPDSQAGGNYKFIDRNVKPEQLYYYFLEDVSSDGTTNINGPVIIKAQSSVKTIWIVLITLATLIMLGITAIASPRRKGNKK